MTEIILKVFVAGFFANFAERRLAYAAIYQQKRKNGWVFAVVTSADHETLRDEFSDQESYDSIQSDKQWVGSWGEALQWADDFDWHAGLPIYCQADFVDRVWEAFRERHSDVERTWHKALQLPKESGATVSSRE